MAPPDGTSVNDIPSRGDGEGVKTGVCRAPGCAKAASAEPIALYPGPGEHCPNCGSRLEPVAPSQPEAPAPPLPEPVAAERPAADAPAPPAPAPPAAGTPDPPVSGPPEAAGAVRPEQLISLEAYQRAHERMMASLAPAPAPKRRWPVRAMAFAGAGIVAVAVGLALGPVLAGRGAGGTVRVCSSSITARLARDVVRSYAAASGVPAARFGEADEGGCDVRFAARASGPSAEAVAHDGIVVVANPQNGLARLSEDQVRRIFSGRVSDWAQVGGEPGPIVALLPGDATDEARALAATLLRDAPPGGGVRRLPFSADVVREVASASGRRAIGLVAFSAAVPAKVLALGDAPAPSVLSIAEHRYPLALAVTVEPGDSPRGGAAGLIDYAHSEQAQAIVVRDGLIARKGF